MSLCHDSGYCDPRQQLWCNGYVCKNNKILKSEEGRRLGDPCSESADCASNACQFVSNETLNELGLHPSTDRLGVCVLQPESLSSQHDFI